MLILENTDKIQLVTSAAATVDTHATFMDCSTTSPPVMDAPDRQNTAVTTAATTDIVATPASGKRRNVKTLHIRNKHATLSTDVTVVFDQNGTDFELHKANLRAGESLEYVEGIGFFTLANPQSLIHGGSNTSDQTINAVDAYIAGSAFNTYNRIKAGTTMRWWISATKTAFGTATPIWSVRVGTAGSTADTARLTFTGLAQTAVADTAMFVIVVNVRTFSASGVISGTYGVAAHRLAATGFINQAIDAAQATSGAFDLTVANSLIGISVNPGAAGVWTIKEVSLDVVNTTDED